MSAQLSLPLQQRLGVRVPTAPKTLKILKALERGEKLTVGRALTEYGVYALSQEIGRLERLGWPVSRRNLPGTTVCEYWRGW